MLVDVIKLTILLLERKYRLCANRTPSFQITHTRYLGKRTAGILRTRAFLMETRIQLMQEIQYFAIFMTLMQRKRDL